MSIVSFPREAGQKLIPHYKPGAMLQSHIADADERAAAAIAQYIAGHGLVADHFEIDYDGATATVSVAGTAADQATREKIVLCCGNVQGVARVVDALSVESPGAPSRYCTVARGDTLSAISKCHYGSAGDYLRIFEANRPMLSSPDTIYPGQVLRIPG